MVIGWAASGGWNWDDVEIPEDLQDCASGKGQNGDGFGTDPTHYDWRKWEKNLGAVDAFMTTKLFVRETQPEWGFSNCSAA